MGNNYKYCKMIVLGSGDLAFQCAMTGRKYLENIEVLDYKVTESTILERLCKKEKISYFLCSKEELFLRLKGEKEQTLVVSAGNTYLIPKEIIGRGNLTVINWHNALLPRHKGRNAEAWCIFEEDTVTGITWHKLTEEIDGGDIYAQEELVIDETVTAIRLYQMQCKLGAQVFDNILEPLLQEECVGVPQARDKKESIHFSYERPNHGILDLKWDYKKMSCFLRAMDYGALQLLGEMKVCWGGIRYRFHRYKIDEDDREEGVYMENDHLVIIKGGHRISLNGLKIENGTEKE